MTLSKICITIYEGHTKIACPLYERFKNVHHGFSEDLKNVRLLFLHLSKIYITIYEGLSNFHLL